MGAEEKEVNKKQKSFNDFDLKNGARQGQNLALNALFVPNWLDSGGATRGGLVFEAHRLLYHSA